jgi:hypothetical protein
MFLLAGFRAAGSAKAGFAALLLGLRWGRAARLPGAAAVLMVIAFLPGVARAQQPGAGVPDEAARGLPVQGVVVDIGTGAPVAVARLRLVPVEPVEGDTLALPDEPAPAPTPQRGADGALRPFEALSDSVGAFRWPRIPQGLYRLEVSAFGYRGIDQEIVIRGAPPVEIRLELVPEALMLDPVVVVVLRSPRLEAGGFYSRRQTGQGTFFDRDEIERRFPSRTSDLLRGLAGVQVQTGPAGQGGRLLIRGTCRPDIVIDGLNLGPNVFPDDLLLPGDIEGVEVHRGPTGPVQYSRGACGMILFWTADPAVRGGDRPFSRRRLLVAVGFILLAFLATR